MESFFEELMEVYRRNRRRIDRGLNLNWRPRSPDISISEFCRDHKGNLVYRHLCGLAFLFSNALGRRMPDSIHARMVLGERNDWVEKYVRYVATLKPHFLWFNPNLNHYDRRTLGPSGSIRRLMLK